MAPSGLGWTIHFGRILKNDSQICTDLNPNVASDNPVIELPDGSRQPLYNARTVNGSGPLFLTPQRWKADCAPGGGGLTVTSPAGVRYDMTVAGIEGAGEPKPRYSWYASKITDRNGNYISIAYSTSTGFPFISSVSTSDGRSLAFTYFNAGTSGARIATITGAPGQTWSYGYQQISGFANKYFLTTVSRPDGTIWRYDNYGNLGTAAGSYLIQRVTYPQGGAVSYSYGWVNFNAQAPGTLTPVVATKVGGSGTWTFAYAPGSGGVHDQTFVNAPNGVTTYWHVGYNTVGSGDVWKVGLLVQKTIGSVQTETYTWDKQVLSNEDYARVAPFNTKADINSVAPIMTGRTINRDGTNYSTTYSSFDAYGNPQLIAETGNASQSRSLTYHVDTNKWIVNQLKDETISGVGSIGRTFDGNGNLSSENKFGVATSFSRHSTGDIHTVTNARGAETTLTNYKRGIPQSEQHPESVSLSRIVSDAGNVVSETNGEGHTTTFTYDGLNRLTSINYPLRNDVAIAWSATARTVTRGGFIETTYFDGFGRPTTINTAGIARSMQYNALGQKTFESYPGSSSGTSFVYDLLDRLHTITHADSSGKSFAYGVGNTVTVTNERAHATTYTYRSFGDPDKKSLSAINAPVSSASMSIARNGLDQITQITQAGLTRSYGYDSRFFLTSETHPETGVTSFGRDPVGNLISRQVGGSPVTIYGYDALNRMTNIAYPSGTHSVALGYNKNNRLTAVSNGLAQRTYSFDANDKIDMESLIVDGITFSPTYGYDGNDQLNTITYPWSGRVVTYSPDALGRPTVAAPYVTGVNYWPSGQLQRISFANGVTTDFGQNARLWPSSIYTRKTSTYLNTAYGYDYAGNPTTITDSVDSSFNRGLSYDAIDRVIRADGPWGAGTSIGYDGAGNITSQVLGGMNLSYGYDGQGRLSTVSGGKNYTFSYDVYGNAIGNGSSAFSYDHASNLRCANCSVNPIQYDYDGKNMRVSTLKNGSKTYEVYTHDGNLLMEYTPATGLLVENIYVAGKRVASRRYDQSTVTTLTTSPNPSATGQPMNLVATVRGGNPTGTVTFKEGAAVLGTAALSGGVASMSASWLTLGAHSLTATYSGDAVNLPSTSGTVSHDVRVTVPTTINFSVGPNPAEAGQSIALSASVNGFNPTGAITFKESGSPLASVALSSGSAILVLPSMSVGNHSLSASYAGDPKNDPSVSGAITQVVTPAATNTALAISPNPSSDGLPVVLTATVTGRSPTGPVTFADGGVVLGTVALNNGVASLSVGNFGFGTHNITADYGGSSNHLTSWASGTLSVTRVGTTTALTASKTSVTPGTSVTFSINVSGAGTNPTGAVTLKNGAATLATLTLVNGAASFATSSLSTATHSITATYSGDGSNAPSTGAIQVTVYDPSVIMTIINNLLLTD